MEEYNPNPQLNYNIIPAYYSRAPPTEYTGTNKKAWAQKWARRHRAGMIFAGLGSKWTGGYQAPGSKSFYLPTSRALLSSAYDLGEISGKKPYAYVTPEKGKPFWESVRALGNTGFTYGKRARRPFAKPVPYIKGLGYVKRDALANLAGLTKEELTAHIANVRGARSAKRKDWVRQHYDIMKQRYTGPDDWILKPRKGLYKEYMGGLKAQRLAAKRQKTETRLNRIYEAAIQRATEKAAQSRLRQMPK